MHQLLKIEDTILANNTHQSITEISDFILQHHQDSNAIAQICDIIVTFLQNQNQNNIDLNPTFPTFSTNLIQHLCTASQQFAANPVTIERIFTALGSILETPLQIESLEISILLCIKVASKAIISSEHTTSTTVVQAIGSCLDEATAALLHTTSISHDSCMVYLMQSLNSISNTNDTNDTNNTNHTNHTNHTNNQNSSIHYLFTAVGNILASMDDPEETNALATRTIDKGLIERAYQWSTDSIHNSMLQASVWHAFEQLSTSNVGREALHASDLNIITLACTTLLQYNIQSTNEDHLNIVSSIYMTLSNLSIENSQLAFKLLNSHDQILKQLLTTMETAPTNTVLVVSGCKLLWNCFVSFQQKEQEQEQEQVIVRLGLIGWNTLLHILNRNRNQNQDRSDVQHASLNALRAVLLCPFVLEKITNVQITKGRKQLIQLITDMDVGMDVSNNQEAQLATIDQEMRVQLIEIVLLCLVKLKTVMSSNDSKDTVDRLKNATILVTLIEFQTDLKLLWNDLIEERVVEEEELASCVVS